MGGSESAGGGSTIDPQIRDAIIDNYNFGKGIASQPYQPYTGQTIADPSAAQQAAEKAGIGMFNTGQQALGTTLSNLGTLQSQGAPTVAQGMGRYSNPYENQVVQSTLNDLNSARMTALGQNADAATRARAFGGSRHGVADSLSNAAFAQQAANTAGQLRSQGFNTAAQLAGQDAGLTMQQRSTAMQAAGMTPQMLQSMYANVGELGKIGAGQTARSQAQLDDAYQAFLEAREFPQQQLALRSGALMGGMGGTYQPGQSSGRNRGASMLGGAGMGAMIGSQMFPLGPAAAAAGATPWGAIGGAGVGLLLGSGLLD